MHLFELVRTLVNIESVSGNEAACTEFLRGYLSDRGFKAELQPVEGSRANVFAQRGNPEVVLSTHVDTVPPFFPASEDEEYIYGRGACNAKGIVAAQIAAAERLAAEVLSLPMHPYLDAAVQDRIVAALEDALRR